jgi:AraC-type transcriptional regulator N-terminus
VIWSPNSPPRLPRSARTPGLWPGLTIYRFTAPVGPTWEEIQSLSLCIVAQGRKAVTVDGQTYLYDPFHYLILASHLHFQAQILEASIGRPFLSFVLQIDPTLVRQVSSDMLERRTTAFRSRQAGPQAVQQACVSALDSELLGVVLRFLRATKTGTDRRVLAPLRAGHPAWCRDVAALEWATVQQEAGIPRCSLPPAAMAQ